jgi:hypothetical protein
MNAIFHEDNMVTYIIHKLHIPPSNAADPSTQIEVTHLTPCLGNPSNKNYEDSLPDFLLPVLIALGFMSGNHEILQNTSPVLPLAITEYVHDGQHASSIWCVMSPQESTTVNITHREILL